MAAGGSTAGMGRAQERLDAAERFLQEAEKAHPVDELRVAKAELGVAKAELGVAKAELKAAPQEEKATAELGVAKAELGVAKAELKAAPQEEKATAELGVAKAELGVAKAEWQAAPKESKDQLWKLVECAQAAVDPSDQPPRFRQFLDEQRRRDEEQQSREEEKERKREDEQRKILAALETSRPPSVHGSITPSSAAQGRENEFYNLLDQMGLSWPPELSTLECSSSIEGTHDNFTFSWKRSTGLSTHFEDLSMQSEDGGVTSALLGSGEDIDEEEASHVQSADDIEEEASHVQSADAREAASYGELCSFLQKRGFDAVVIGNGEGLPNRLLFSTYAHSMRQQVLTVKGQAVYTGMRVYGRTDLVILDNRGRQGEVRRQRVKLGIEVKPADKIGRCEDASNPASREAATQLIGLNINNMYNTPPVLLTNLQKIHWVFYISDHEEHPWFRMARKKFSRFIDALRFVEEHLWATNKCHYEFGRGSSPAESEGISA
eukprot:CAMPEP_0172069406 /NCGR_PEP_ID=MMETSP1043-20130122/12716_1 /TAXON_ID=464988 /ORGANISM="Hemiselmis andersenii, Strain CCMP441" /LENGTH=492 /DNA_ID=CAMNT_0012729707 /DNA_START=273 /DNA_END=1752 /DNA_ORIENTATION=-